jgi:YHS domain-containing protein
MRLTGFFTGIVPAVCAVFAIVSVSVRAQSNTKVDAPKPAAEARQLKPQTTCPVTGDPIDKKLYVDYNGKRIYVCCSSCLADLKKDPEKYIKKLESQGQSVETIGIESKKGSKASTADTSAKKMDMKGAKISGDTTAKAVEAGYWTCPMHPEIHKATAGQCPICGMNLVYKKSDKDTTKMKGTDHSKMKM